MLEGLNCKLIHIIGGGTISHVRNHLALCVPAFGSTAKILYELFEEKIPQERRYDLFKDDDSSLWTSLKLTKLAGGIDLETNEDVEKYVDELIADERTKVIIFNVALVDFKGQIENVPSGKYANRLETKEGPKVMHLSPTEKIIGKIRKTRKDIFVVGFKTTAGATTDQQYIKGLELLKKNSLNLVLANDTITRNNMIIAPEETRYGETTDRSAILKTLVDITLSRMDNTFTRSTVVEGQPIEWKSSEVPENLRTVVNHCIEHGAYKPFLGKTAGHFAVKINEGEILTTIRKTNFNELDNHGLVRVEYNGIDSVIAHGAKPSVGGMSQRIIFTEHPDVDCIVHFHCPPKFDHVKTYDNRIKAMVNPVLQENQISTRPQMYNECGSHQCGKNTSDGLDTINLGDGDYLKVVYLDQHGPNIVFNRKTPAEKVINYIEKTFDLSQKTGGLV